MTLLVELTNIAGGYILSCTLLAKIPNIGAQLKQGAKWLSKYTSLIGTLMLILGFVTLIAAFGIYIPLFYGSFIQAFAGIFGGAILLGKVNKKGSYHKLYKSTLNYHELIGILIILIGFFGMF